MRSSLRSVLGPLLFLLFTEANVARTQGGSPCQSLNNYVHQHPECRVFRNFNPDAESSGLESCTGLLCSSPNGSVSYFYTEFSVQRCEDPVTVAVYTDFVSDEFSDYFGYVYNQSETVDRFQEDDSRNYYTAIIDRNASYVGFEMFVEHGADRHFLSVFEGVYIPLYPHQCMCSSMDTMAADINLDLLGLSGYNCTSSTDCKHVVCRLPDSPDPFINVTINPCDQPASLDLKIQGQTTIHADHNISTTVESIELDLYIWHFNYSMDVQLTAVTEFFNRVILPRHKIILDLRECGPPRPLNISGESTIPPTEITEPTISTTPTDGTYDTCAALNSVTVTDGGLCSTNDACNALECEIADRRLEIGVESCHDPPGIRLRVYDADDNVLYNREFYNGTHEVRSQYLPYGKLVVTVKQISEYAISVKVTGEAPFGFISIPIVPTTIIPIDPYQCATLPPTTTPTTTCAAMESIQYTLRYGLFNSSCYFPLQPNCSVLTCPLEGGVNFTIKLLRCAHPPAIEIRFSNDSVVYFDEVFDHSRSAPLDGISDANGTTLDVTLDQLCPSDIGFQANVIYEEHDTVFIPYTVIPVNTTGCGSSGTGVVCPSISVPPRPSSTTHSHSTSSSSSSSHSTSSSSSSSSHSTSSSGSSSHSTTSSGSSTTAQTSPTPVAPISTCDAMKDISKQLTTNLYAISTKCVLKGCDVIQCTTSKGPLTFTLHCSSPVGMEISGFSNESKLFTKTGNIPLPANTTMKVTVDNKKNKILGFGLDLFVPGVQNITVVNYTQIPLDDCPGSGSSSTYPGSGSSSTYPGSGTSSSSSGPSVPVIAAAVVVPVVLLLLVVAVVVIIVGVYYGRRRRGRNYNFQRMAMSEVDDYDE